jgi:hypothetical protein
LSGIGGVNDMSDLKQFMDEFPVISESLDLKQIEDNIELLES